MYCYCCYCCYQYLESSHLRRRGKDIQIRTHPNHHLLQGTEPVFEDLLPELPAAELSPGLVSVCTIDDDSSY